MRKENPLHQIELGLESGFFFGHDPPAGLTDIAFLWRFLEDYLARLPAEIRRPALSHRGPEGVRPSSDLQGRIMQWAVISELQRVSTEFCFVIVRSFLPALEEALSSRWLLPACALARTVLEHAAAGYYQAMLLEMEAPELLRHDKSYLLGNDPPRTLFDSFWKVLDGTRFPWSTRDEILGAKKAQEAEKAITEAERQTSILSVLEKVEKRGAQPGLVHKYNLLCDCVHPSRGTRELLFTTTFMDEEQLIGHGYSDRIPEDAYLDRVKGVICPALVHCYQCLNGVFGDRLKTSKWLVRTADELCVEHNIERRAF